MHVAKNDTVEVIAGNSAGTRGKVLKVFPDRKRVVVEKVNMIRRHTKASQKNPAGGILEKEAPIHVSNVMLVCPKCGKATRVAHTPLADGGKERSCRHCREMIPRLR